MKIGDWLSRLFPAFCLQGNHYVSSDAPSSILFILLAISVLVKLIGPALFIGTQVRSRGAICCMRSQIDGGLLQDYGVSALYKDPFNNG